MTVTFCHVCNRMILQGFLYCPYCGAQQLAGPDLEHAAGVSFSKMETMQAKARSVHIQELIEELESIEADVESFMGDTGTPALKKYR